MSAARMHELLFKNGPAVDHCVTEPICRRAANSNRKALTRTGFYGANAFLVATVVYSIGVPAILASLVFSGCFIAFARLGERR